MGERKMPVAYHVVQAKDGNWILEIEKAGKKYRLNSAYYPVEEAKRWACQYEVKNLNVQYILFGLGNGCFLSELLKVCKEDTTIMVYEPDASLYDAVLQATKENIGCSQFHVLSDKRIYLVVEGCGTTLYEMFNAQFGRAGEIKLLCHPVYNLVYPGQYEILKKEIEEARKRMQAQRNTANAFGKKIIMNQLYSLAHQKDAAGLSELRKQLDMSVPALIISSGPSLTEMVEEIKIWKDFFYLIVVDSSVNYLIHHGIIPDLIITIDPNKFQGHIKKQEALYLPLLCRMDANYQILERHQGQKIFIGSSFFATNLMKAFKKTDEWIEDTGGSVSTAAFSVCQKLGFETIVLVGQDLCYRIDDERKITATHVKGRISVDEKRQGFERQWIEANDGRKVLTRQDWYRYLKWIEDAIKHSPRIKVINVTRGGARIRGAVYMELSEFMRTVERKKPIKSIVCEKCFSKEDFLKLESVLYSMKPLAEQMHLMAKRMVLLSEQLLKLIYKKQVYSPEFLKIADEVDKNNQWMNQQMLTPAIELLMGTEEEPVDEVFDDEYENYKITYECVSSIYKRMQPAILEVVELIDQFITREKN